MSPLTEHAALTALRTQQVTAEESGVTSTVDPPAGSYFLVLHRGAVWPHPGHLGPTLAHCYPLPPARA